MPGNHRREPPQFYEKTTPVSLSNRRRADRGRTLPRRLGPGRAKERGNEAVALSFGQHLEESGHGGSQREGQILHERSRPRRNDGSRHGQDGPAKRQKPRREENR